MFADMGCPFKLILFSMNKLIFKEFDAIKRDFEDIKRYSLLGAKTVLNIDDVCLFTGLSKSHVYKLTCNREIPHYKKNGKMLFFDKAEIEAWMKDNRVETRQEAEQMAISYVVGKGGRR